MNSPNLGRLEKIPLRDIWRHEALHFTPWLLENVDVLNTLLGMNLVLDVAEDPVGTFRLDLKGRDEVTGETVIVENQLETSDHTHLGQIITYAAGTDPTTIIWLAAKFRPEHRAAIDWLNQRTDENTRVFGVEIQVVRIGESEPAPNFDLVAQPNDWEKQVRRVSATVPRHPEFWKAVLERIRGAHPEWERPQLGADWCSTSVETGGVVLSIAWQNQELVSQIYFSSPDPELNQARFDWLAGQPKFHAALGGDAKWDEMDGRGRLRIAVSSSVGDIDNTEQWPAMIDWAIEQQHRLREALNLVGAVSAFKAAARPGGRLGQNA